MYHVPVFQARFCTPGRLRSPLWRSAWERQPATMRSMWPAAGCGASSQDAVPFCAAAEGVASPARRCSTTGGRRTRRVTASAAEAPSAPEITEELEPGTKIYARPELYDASFGYRNFKEECLFLRDAFKAHAPGSALTSTLDMGCGPSRHLVGLAKYAGVQRLVGLDLSPEMLAYAQGLVDKAGSLGSAKLQLVQGDMTNFDLPEKNFDLVTCLLGTFSHLLENKQAAAAFRCVHKHLRPGGLFMLELAHPGDLFDGTLILGDGGKEMWELKVGKDQKVLSEWGTEFDNFDPTTQILYRTVSINLFKGETLQESVEEVVPYRQYTVGELDLLCTLTGFTVEALYGEMKLECDLNHEDAYRMVAVMRKAEQ